MKTLFFLLLIIVTFGVGCGTPIYHYRSRATYINPYPYGTGRHLSLDPAPIGRDPAYRQYGTTSNGSPVYRDHYPPRWGDGAFIHVQGGAHIQK
ncbi:MAG: hypothetical protein COV01_03920 [Candidatus Taylorbacteria bacterium CG10_big_fil_rev_8_21_14_0_10_41_48]|uniref:Uncharacterized protein n=1 Tax=Candidatus Taylorbacteria bacterium CG10_big_fil_rev_8_21_14_0_10_41_48 TaxID=1975024 RepID=A0A2M8LB27_9BACT|nr:MAG: hypothetical protein COV01_03920 [Candidatus Taylorbacteria bacterium CG10_big_fil_rev_8_21_14_0_10_41_48]